MTGSTVAFIMAAMLWGSVFLGVRWCTTPAHAGTISPDGSLPREAGVERVSQATLIDLQSCIVRMWASRGQITTVPLPSGVAIDWSIKMPFAAGSGQAGLTFEIRDAPDGRHISARYRHPLSAKAAVRFLDETTKRCAPDA